MNQEQVTDYFRKMQRDTAPKVFVPSVRVTELGPKQMLWMKLKGWIDGRRVEGCLERGAV